MASVDAAAPWLRERPIAHRGLHGPGRPENSPAAVASAHVHGYAVEIDIRFSRDGDPMVVHDVSLGRVADGDDRIARSTTAALRRRRLDGTDERLPTLADVVAASGDAPLLLDLKAATPRRDPVRAIVDVMRSHEGPWCVASWHPRLLAHWRQACPDVARVLVTGVGPVGLPALLPVAIARTAPVALSVRHDRLDGARVRRWRASGRTVLAWTVRDESQLTHALHHADNVLFEHVRPPVA